MVQGIKGELDKTSFSLPPKGQRGEERGRKRRKCFMWVLVWRPYDVCREGEKFVFFCGGAADHIYVTDLGLLRIPYRSYADISGERGGAEDDGREPRDDEGEER
ncbi:hypothetical protein SLE2022_096790 [Rubroshorea leprosula]